MYKNIAFFFQSEKIYTVQLTFEKNYNYILKR